MYGPLEPSTTSYLQPTLPHSLPPRPAPELPKPTPPPPPPAVVASSGQQMVTIRRVMGNMSEPVVTVTLKGQSADAPDRVLFTLVNGQVLSNGDKSTPTTGSAAASAAPVTPAAPAVPLSRKKQKKKEKKMLKRQQQQQLEQQQQQQQHQNHLHHQQHQPSMMMNGSATSFSHSQQTYQRLQQVIFHRVATFLDFFTV